MREITFSKFVMGESHAYQEPVPYPITINRIVAHDEWNSLYDPGQLVSVRPCGEEYEGKTYLGILLGELPTRTSFGIDDDGVLSVRSKTNPAMYVFELKKIIFGYESFWGRIESPEQLRHITNEDIQGQWYVQLLNSIAKEDETA